MVEENEVEVVEVKSNANVDVKDRLRGDWTKQLDLVKAIVAKGCTNEEFQLLCYTAKLYGLNPLKKEIWAVKYTGKPALVFTSRDGFLTIAHSTGQFGSMETTFEMPPNVPGTIKSVPAVPVSATCTIWRKDYDKPFKCTVYFDEYNQKQALWLSKPKMMLQKVAESSCLRRAFNISGLYAPEEIDADNTVNNTEVKE